MDVQYIKTETFQGVSSNYRMINHDTSYYSYYTYTAFNHISVIAIIAITAITSIIASYMGFSFFWTTVVALRWVWWAHKVDKGRR